MDSMEEMQRLRWSALFQLVNPMPFGALFRVDEEVWSALAGPVYVRNKTRSNHPGCSITRIYSTLGPVAMLHGTSRKDYRKDVIAVKNVYGEEHVTWFGGLDPIPIDFALFQKRKVRPAEKAKVDATELKALEVLCSRRGWSHV